MRRYTITVNDTTKVIDVEVVAANNFRVQLDGRLIDVSLDDHRDLAHSEITPGVQVRSTSPAATAPVGGATATSATRPAAPPARPPAAARPSAAPAASGGGRTDMVTAPMPGVILSLETAEGKTVSRGDVLMVLEAMKMKNELRAPRDGEVAEIYVQPAQQVKYGEFLLRFEEN